MCACACVCVFVICTYLLLGTGVLTEPGTKLMAIKLQKLSPSHPTPHNANIKGMIMAMSSFFRHVLRIWTQFLMLVYYWALSLASLPKKLNLGWLGGFWKVSQKGSLTPKAMLTVTILDLPRILGCKSDNNNRKGVRPMEGEQLGIHLSGDDSTLAQSAKPCSFGYGSPQQWQWPTVLPYHLVITPKASPTLDKINYLRQGAIMARHWRVTTVTINLSGLLVITLKQ